MPRATHTHLATATARRVTDRVTRAGRLADEHHDVPILQVRAIGCLTGQHQRLPPAAAAAPDAVPPSVIVVRVGADEAVAQGRWSGDPLHIISPNADCVQAVWQCVPWHKLSLSCLAARAGHLSCGFKLPSAVQLLCSTCRQHAAAVLMRTAMTPRPCPPGCVAGATTDPGAAACFWSLRWRVSHCMDPHANGHRRSPRYRHARPARLQACTPKRIGPFGAV